MLSGRNFFLWDQGDSNGSHYGFKLVGDGVSRFNVATESNTNRRSVDFVLPEKKIKVLRESAPMFQATVSLNDEGESILLVDGIERKRWQVLKIALDELFLEVF